MSRLFHKRERQESSEGQETSAEAVNSTTNGNNNANGTIPGGISEVASGESTGGTPQVIAASGISSGNQVVALVNRKSKTIEHIKSYPLVQQTTYVLERLPPVRVVAANVRPVVSTVVNSKPVGMIQPVTNVADSVIDKSLSVTEKVVPSLKTKTYQRLGEELMTPYTLTKTVVVKTANNSVNVAHAYLYQPTHEQVLKFRKYYNERLINTHGKPLIRGSFDFAVGPANNQYEKLITKVLPNGKPVPQTGYTNEVDRSVALTFNLVTRLVPAAAKKSTKVLTGPYSYAKHVNDVFNESLNKQENLLWANSWKAAKQAINELNQETLGHVKHMIPGSTDGSSRAAIRRQFSKENAASPTSTSQQQQQQQQVSPAVKDQQSKKHVADVPRPVSQMAQNVNSGAGVPVMTGTPGTASSTPGPLAANTVNTAVRQN